MHATLTPDGQRFLHRLQKSLPFVAHMSGIERIEWCGRFGEFDHFLGSAPATGSIDQPRRETAGALLQSQFHMTAHGDEFRWGWFSI